MLLAVTLLLAGVQDAPPPPGTVNRPEQAKDGSQRWSILVDACGREAREGEDIVVCGSAEQSQRLPYPEAMGPPDRPMPSNPDLSGSGALAAVSTPCAARVGACQVGVDVFGGATFLTRLVGKVIDPDSCCEEPGEATNPIKLVGDLGSAVGRAFKKKPDKSKRVPIPLDDPAPQGR